MFNVVGMVIPHTFNYKNGLGGPMSQGIIDTREIWAVKSLALTLTNLL